MKRQTLLCLALVALTLGQLAAAKGGSMLAEKVSAKKAAVSAKVSAKLAAISAKLAPLAAAGTDKLPSVSKMQGPEGEVSPGAAPVVPDQCQSAWDIVKSSDDFTILAAAIEAAGLVATLDDPALMATVFAPTNQAFIDLLLLLELDVETLLADPVNLGLILKNHVIPEESLAKEDFLDTQGYETLACVEEKDPIKKTVEEVCDEVFFNFDKVFDLKVAKDDGLAASREDVYEMVPTGGDAAEFEAFDIQVGCPTAVHSLAGVLIPGIEIPAEPIDFAAVYAEAGADLPTKP